MFSTIRIFGIFITAVVMSFITVILMLSSVQSVTAQEINILNEDCASIQYLMQQEITPADLPSTGGILTANTPATVQFGPNTYADYRVFNLVRPTDERNTQQDVQLTLSFRNLPQNSGLEMGVFRGMEQLTDSSGQTGLQPLLPGISYNYELTEDDIYTVVVQRQRALPQMQTLSYELTASFTGQVELPAQVTVQDESVGGDVPFSRANGLESVVISGVNFRFHTGSVQAISSQNGRAGQLFFNTSTAHRILLDTDTQAASFLGGDFAATGTTAGHNRIFYLKDYGYASEYLEGNLRTIRDAFNNSLSIDWTSVTGVWMLQGCAGVRLVDGYTFVIPIDSSQRQIQLTGNLDDFTLQIAAPARNGEIVSHTINLSLDLVETGSEIQFTSSIFSARLTNNRTIRLESTALSLFYETTENATTEQPVRARLDDTDTTIILDWTNMQNFELAQDNLVLGFTDAPRTSTIRSGMSVRQVEALDDIVHIVYHDTQAGQGEERLLLPASESYIELVTPAGMPAHDGQQLPGVSSTYIPRGLNNTGGDCYPVNTMLPEANCPEAGHPNPANGNLWYKVMDHHASGGWLDLTLSRSYNSRYYRVDGPFGYGWTSEYLLDYRAAFDLQTSSRPISPASFQQDAATAYAVALDLTYAPRGSVIFTTATGSRHQFVIDTNNSPYRTGIMRAVTMPGWTLERESLRSPEWILTQPDGLTYRFDRAGRPISYGYPDRDRVITIDYPGTYINGLSEAGAEPVIITDHIDFRQIELYYDENHHIIRSVLRDLTTDNDITTCDPANTCFEIIYNYENGYLQSVTYPSGEQTSYVYENGLLIEHNDQRAPISPYMRYSYDSDGAIQDIQIIDTSQPDAPVLWRQLQAAPSNTGEIANTLTDDKGTQQTFTYIHEAGSLKAAQQTFTLVSSTSPLADVEDVESVPRTFVWENGLLIRENTRVIPGEAGINRTAFTYTDSGAIQSITRDQLSSLALDFNEGNIQVNYLDRTSETYDYDDTGRVIRSVNRHGGITEYLWQGNDLVTLQQPDGTRTDYQFNAIGLVTQVTRSTITTNETGHRTEFEYDGTGRLIGVTDDLIGTSTIEYDIPQLDPQTNTTHYQLHITSSPGASYSATLDSRHRILSQQLADISGTILRANRYTYDWQDRIVNAQELLNPVNISSGNEESRWLTTTYTYQHMSTLPVSGPQLPEITIRGYQITVTDPTTRTSQYIYDALDRLRQINHSDGSIERFNYLHPPASEISQLTGNGLRQALLIEHTTQTVDGHINTTQYIFDSKGQLRSVVEGDKRWLLRVVDGVTNVYNLQESPENFIGSLTWDTPAGQPYPASITQNQVDYPALESRYQVSQEDPAYTVTYDTLGRVTGISDANNNLWQKIYCPQPDGGLRLIYADSDVTSGILDCNSTSFSQSIQYDALDRVIRTETSTGIQTISYAALDNVWQAEVTFTGLDEQSFTQQWQFNLMGEPVRFVDEYGIVRIYEYDTLGRLRRYVIEDEPEASYKLDYDDNHMLISEINDRQQGFTYDYNQRGQVILQQDVRTADSTIFTYTPDGMISTIISPLGNSTTYLYENPINPHRITGIIDTGGAQHRFVYEDNGSNQLTYINAANQTTNYSFDSIGLLWRIDDALNQSHELRYDAMGRVTEWRQAQTGNSSAQLFTLSYPSLRQINVAERETPDWQQALSFTPTGQLETVTANNTMLFELSYDVMERLSSIHAGLETWQFTYSNGEPTIQLLTPQQKIQLMTFDSLSRLLLKQHNEATTTYDYQSADSVSQTNIYISGLTDRIYTIDTGNGVENPPSIIARAPGQRIRYIYDAEGLLISIVTETCLEATEIDVQQVLTIDSCVDTGETWTKSSSFIYDASSRLIRAIDENQNTQTFTYDENDNLITYQTASGQTVLYEYDALNRLISLSEPSGIKLLFSYDAQDNVTGICRTQTQTSSDYTSCINEGEELERYEYDSTGRLLQRLFHPVSGNNTSGITYTYNNSSQLASFAYSGYQPVTLTYEQTGLQRLESFNTNNNQYRFVYEDVDRSIEQGNLRYTYDDYGRLNSIDTGTQQIDIEYEANNEGYTLTDRNSGAGIAFRLDTYGRLISMTDTSAGAASVNFQYGRPDNDTLPVFIDWGNTETIELKLDRNGSVRSLIYVINDVTLEYVSDAVGLVRRQSFLSGIPQNPLFATEGGGYTVVNGYDSSSRPLTTRIVDRNGRLLYQATFTHNNVGNRVRETRQYEDGTQVDSSFRYEQDRLVETIITITDGDNTTTPAIPVVGGLILFFLIQHRRWRVISIASLLLILPSPFIFAQQSTNLDYIYGYDSAGNLIQQTVRIDGETQECATYTYDNYSRLNTITRQDGIQRNYVYDAQNRLAQVNNTQLIYTTSNNLLLAEGKLQMQIKDNPAFAILQSGNPTWILNDGREYLLSYVNESETTPLWLFDPYGQFISLDPPDIDENPCQLIELPEELTESTPIEQHNMIWDPTVNLYFDEDGRTYLPDIARFLQRDSLGPDIAGNLYGYPTREIEPPRQPFTPAHLQGLTMLNEGVKINQINKTLTAEAVQQRYVAGITANSPHDFYNRLQQSERIVREHMTRQLNLPVWLTNIYNVPFPQIAASGELIYSLSAVPAHGYPAEAELPDFDSVFEQQATIIQVPSFANLMQQFIPEPAITTGPYSYEPLKYVVTPDYFQLAITAPPTSEPQLNPGGVYPHLTRILTSPEASLETLQLIETVRDIPTTNTAELLNAEIDRALPDAFVLPSVDSKDWLTERFSYDFASIQQHLDVQSHLPEGPDMFIPDYLNSAYWSQP